MTRTEFRKLRRGDVVAKYRNCVMGMVMHADSLGRVVIMWQDGYPETLTVYRPEIRSLRMYKRSRAMQDSWEVR